MSPALVTPTRLSEGALFRIDKPAGPTSHDVVHAVRRHLGVRRVGHAGTLDPPATGLLVIGVGPATRLLSFVAAQDKTYRGVLALGTATDTLDATGAVVAASEWPRDEARVREAAAGFLGESVQTVPLVSAVKVRGQRLYRWAARGEIVQAPERQIRVERFEVGQVDLESGRVEFEIICSSGTYVRAIAQAWGERLGSAAHLHALRRLAVGRISVRGAFPGERLAPRGEHPAGEGARRGDPPPAGWRDLEPALLDWNVALSHIPARRLDETEAASLRYGRAPGCRGEAGLVRLVDDEERLLAVAEGSEAPVLRLRCVLAAARPDA